MHLPPSQVPPPEIHHQFDFNCDVEEYYEYIARVLCDLQNMPNQVGSLATPTRRRLLFFRRPRSIASTTSAASITTTLPEYSNEQTESDEAPRSSNVLPSVPGLVAPSQHHVLSPQIPLSRSSSISQSSRPPNYSIPRSRTSSISQSSGPPNYSIISRNLENGGSELIIEEARSSSVPLSVPEPVAPSQQHRPFRPLPPIPLPRIPLSRSSTITQSSRPPNYSIISGNLEGGISRIERSFPLLVGGGSEPHIEHSFPLGGPNSWATLYTFTPKSVPGLVHDFESAKRNIPTFIEGRDIMGTLELELEGTQTIQKILVTIQGTILTGSLATEIQKFLFFKHNIWHKSFGDPRQPTQKSDGRLSGSYQFPFSFPFPAHIDSDAYSDVQTVVSPFPLATGPSTTDTATPSPSAAVQEKLRSSVPDTTSVQRSAPSQAGNITEERREKPRSVLPQTAPQTRVANTAASPGLFYPTPGSFAERSITVRVQYELHVRIIHGRFRPDSKINTNIAYLPVLKPSPFSVKRKKAYETNALPPGPLKDPEGWFALPKAPIKGQLGGRKVQIDCILHLAIPLCYTRGSIIPCFLTLSSDDVDALDSLSAPKSPFVRLTRRLQHFSPRGATNKEGKQDSELFAGREDPSSPYTWIVPPAGDNSGKSGSLKSLNHGVGVAKWWVPPKGILEATYVRYLEGEIHLESDLQPSSSCPLFLVEYFVEIFSFVSDGFEPDPNTWGDPRMRAISSTRVEIVTAHDLDEPIPVPFTETPNAVPRAPTSASASGSGSGTSNIASETDRNTAEGLVN